MSIHGVLGETTTYPKIYSPQSLYPIPRQAGRLNILKQTNFDFNTLNSQFGVDVWQAFELSWLNPFGVSQVAMARITIPADSPNMVESKSLKLYLNGLNFSQFDDIHHLQTTLQQDIAKCVGATIDVQIMQLDNHGYNHLLMIQEPIGECIDGVLNHTHTRVRLTDDIESTFLNTRQKSTDLCDYQFYSHLLRSNCPVTNQPDWGTVQIQLSTRYTLDFGAVLNYILSFRQHNGFHEQCVERIFADFMQAFEPIRLKVQANYTRRGGIDINPVRVFNTDIGVVNRLIRQ